MLPLIIGGGLAAAALLSGCDSNEEEKKTPADGGPNPTTFDGAALLPVPAPSTSVPVMHPDALNNVLGIPNAPALPAPPPPSLYLASFGNDLKATRIYHRLKDRGVSDEDLDKGCDDRGNFDKLLRGSGDNRIEACEVYKYAINNYQKFADLVEGITGKPIHWSLDDRDPKTSFDEKIREKVEKALVRFKDNPMIQGLDPQGEVYREKLAVALFYFTDFPENPPTGKPQRETWLKKSQELRDIGLPDFQEWLLKNGGLGTSQFSTGSHAVYPALTALRKKTGNENYSKANILYSVFDQAGLSPVFFSGNGPAAKDTKVPRLSQKIPGVMLMEDIQVAVGISLGNKTRLFNLAAVESDAQYSKFTQVTPTNYLSWSLGYQGNDLIVTDHNYAKAIEAARQSIDLTPSYSVSYNILGVALHALGNLRDAETAYLESARLEWRNNPAYLNLAALYTQQGNLEKGAEYYYSAYAFDIGRFWDFEDKVFESAQKLLKQTPSHATASFLVKLIQNRRDDKKAEETGIR